MSIDLGRVGTDDYISRSATVIDHNAPYTIMVWGKIDADPNDYQHFIHVGGPFSYNGNTDFTGTDTDGQLLRFGCAGGASNSFLTTGSHYLTVAAYYWFAQVRESATSLKVLFGTDDTDGVVVATMTDNVSARAAATFMSLGGYNNTNLNGKIAKPRIWTRALTLAQLHAEAASASIVDATNIWSAPAFAGADFTAAMADTSGQGRNWTRNGTDSTISTDEPTYPAAPPVVSSLAITPTSSSLFNASFNTNKSGGDAYYLVDGNATRTGPQVVAAANSQAVTASGAQSLTGLSWTAGQYVHIVHVDADGTSNVLEGLVADTTVPVATGPLTKTNDTYTGYRISGFGATDNVAVTKWRHRIEGGSWTEHGAITYIDITGRMHGDTETVDVQAGDAAGNWSNTLTIEAHVGWRDETIHALSFPMSGAGNTEIRMLMDPPVSRTNCTLIWKQKVSSQTDYYGGMLFAPIAPAGYFDSGRFTVMAVQHGCDGTYDAAGQRNVQQATPIYEELAALYDGSVGSHDFISSPVSIVGSGNQASFLVEFEEWHTKALTVELIGGTTLRHTYYVDFEGDPTKTIIQDTPLSALDLEDTGNPGVFFDPGLYFGTPPWINGFNAPEAAYGKHYYFKAFTGVLSVPDILSEATSNSDDAVTAAGIAGAYYSNIAPLATDITDKSGEGHDFVWTTSNRPANYSETVEIEVPEPATTEGQLTVTLAAMAAAATGAVRVSGALARTLAGLALASAGTARATGQLGATLGALSVSASGQVPVVGAAAIPLGAMSLTATGNVGSTAIVGTASITLAGATAAATGQVRVSGGLIAGISGVSLSASGGARVSGAASIALGAMTLSATGTLPGPGTITGNLAATLAAVTLSSSGLIRVTGAASRALDGLSASAVGATTVRGQLAAVLDGMQLVAAGGGLNQGSATIQLDGMTLSAIGIVRTLSTEPSVYRSIVPAGNYMSLVPAGEYASRVSIDIYSSTVPVN